MTDYAQIANDLNRFSSWMDDRVVDELLMNASAAMKELCADLRTCRNELCLRCGKYREAHKGACDGCRWKECPW